MGEQGVLNQRIRDFSKQTDIIQTIILFLVALLVPTFLGQLLTAIFGAQSAIALNSQLVVGSIVNTALVLAATNLKGIAKIIGIVTMPSISAIFGGYVFPTPASTYMMYMIPAIWLGNFVLVYAYKFIMLGKGKNYFLAGIVGIIAKVAIIFAGFSILNAAINIPEKIANNLSSAMSITQAITATIGVILAFGIIQLIKTDRKEKLEGAE